ncbi:MAG: LCP family protein [Bacilli bacterium]|nr:LCP family protein [Bacilli bacterium]
MLTRKQKRLISLAAIFVVSVLSVVLTYTVIDIDLIPAKYLLLFVAIILTLNILSAACLLVKKVWTRVIAVIIHIILIVLSIAGINYIGKADNFLDEAFENYTVDTTVYNIVVSSEGNYKTLEDLKGRDVSYFNFYNNIDGIKDEVSKKIDGPTMKEQLDMMSTFELLFNGEISSVILAEGFKDELAEMIPEFDSKVLVLDTFEVETKVGEDTLPDHNAPNEGETTTTVTTKELQKLSQGDAINIYISGVDYGSRSDLNMIATINPNTKKILLTSIPRDCAAVIPGVGTGKPEKLSYSGLYGLNTSRYVVEQVTGIKFDYAIKVTFNSIVKMVDLVGGIDIVSDKEFKAFHMPGWTVKKGKNHMDGAKALAYARERQAYAPNGDVHRVLNQQQVVSATLNKLAKDRSLLLKYDEILNSLSSFYTTDIPRSVISKYVKMQLNNMSGWSITSQSIKGSYYDDYTNYFQTVTTHLFKPSESSLQKNINKIKNVVAGK